MDRAAMERRVEIKRELARRSTRTDAEIAERDKVMEKERQLNRMELAHGVSNTVLGPLELAANVLPDTVTNWLGRGYDQAQDAVGAALPERPAGGLNEMLRARQVRYDAARAAGGREGFSGSEMLGSFLNPALNAGAVKAAGAAGAGLAKVAPNLPQWLQTAIQAGTGGAVFGAAQPVAGDPEAYAADKATSVGLSAGLGAGLGVAGSAAKGVINKLKPIANLVLPGGASRIAAETQAANVGDKYIPVVADALSSARPHVPGSLPTAAEAVAGVPGGTAVIAGQKITASTPGGVSGDFEARALAQQAARLAPVKHLAETGSLTGKPAGSVKTLEAWRTRATSPLYESARKSTAKINALPVVKRMNEIRRDNPANTAVLKTLDRLHQKMIVNDRLTSEPRVLISVLDEAKNMAKPKAGPGDNEYDMKVLFEIKGLLKDQVNKAVPAYRAAEKRFAEMSIPINRMQAAQYLESKMAPPTGVESPGSYMRALDDAPKLFKTSTGFDRFSKLEDVFTPAQSNMLRKVAMDYERLLLSKRPAQVTNITGANNVALVQSPKIPQLLSQPVAMFHAVMKAAGRNIEPKIDRIMSDQYLNPAELARVLRQQSMKPNSTVPPWLYGAAGVPALQQGQRDRNTK